MSQPAKKRPAPASAVADEARDQEGSGRFVVAQSRPTTMLPPTSAAAEGAQGLDAGALPEFEPDALEEAAPPQRGIVSGVFANGGAAPNDARDDELDDAVASSHAYYREGERQQHERAHLEIEDFSLLPGNPYAASSLIPPTRKPLALGKALGFVALAGALGTGAWLVQRETSNARDEAASTARAVAAASGPVASQRIGGPTSPKVQPPQPMTTVAIAATPPAARQETPAPTADIRLASASARKAAVAMEAREAARPVAVQAAHEESAHEAVAQAALRAALAGSAPDSAKTSVTPIELPVAVALPTVAATADATANDMGALPDLPSREDVVTGFERTRDELSKCAGDKHGTVQIDATIANSGRVSRALIKGVFMGTAEGSCMARAARAARFPQFSQSSLGVSYPIAL